MSKRFTETDKWRDPWFRKLTPLQKCLFGYLCDNCNNAGFIEIDVEGWSLYICCTCKDLQKAWEGLIRGFIVADGWAFVRNYLKHQKHLPLSPDKNPAHKQIAGMFRDQELRFPRLLEKIMQGHSIEAPTEGLGSPIGEGEGIGEGKLKAKTAVALPFESDAFSTVWTAWLEHRRKIHKPMTEYAQRLTLKKLPSVESEAARWIENALEKGWQGIYEPTDGKAVKQVTSKPKEMVWPPL